MLVSGIIFLSIASTKRTLYLMPIFASVAMLTASYIDSTIRIAELSAKIGKDILLGLHHCFIHDRLCPDTNLFLC